MLETIIIAILTITVVGLGALVIMLHDRVEQMKGGIHRIERENRALLHHNRILSSKLKGGLK